MKPRHWPFTFIFFSILGLVCLAVGGIALAGLGGAWHPLLADEGAGIGFIVTAIALLLSGAFPLVLRRLAEREGV